MDPMYYYDRVFTACATGHQVFMSLWMGVWRADDVILEPRPTGEPPNAALHKLSIPSGRRHRGGRALEAELRRSETAAHALVRVLDRIFREDKDAVGVSISADGGFLRAVADFTEDCTSSHEKQRETADHAVVFVLGRISVTRARTRWGFQNLILDCPGLDESDQTRPSINISSSRFPFARDALLAPLAAPPRAVTRTIEDALQDANAKTFKTPYHLSLTASPVLEFYILYTGIFITMRLFPDDSKEAQAYKTMMKPSTEKVKLTHELLVDAALFKAAEAYEKHCIENDGKPQTLEEAKTFIFGCVGDFVDDIVKTIGLNAIDNAKASRDAQKKLNNTEVIE
ncbi:hypothetical protein DFH08DRAFT_1071693 [Mycena albidolilacea]|uniref:Uncharacterized protein n=1 Tax=Mycena albidolilacea TaxID=1033008 RepID=A0AAD7AQB6_9AGAR|nr:hypothetical protein DFH08DRAFT_1071693 [Mycena albidolilacea]